MQKEHFCATEKDFFGGQIQTRLVSFLFFVSVSLKLKEIILSFRIDDVDNLFYFSCKDTKKLKEKLCL